MNVNPFSQDDVQEVPLAPSPVEKVIVQISFPLSPELADLKNLGPLQKLLSPDYPILREEQAVSLTFSSDGTSEQKVRNYFRFSAEDGRSSLSTGPSFLSIELQDYRSRDALAARFDKAVGHLVELDLVQRIDRLGIRYINRLRDEDCSSTRLRKLVSSPALGAMTIASTLPETAPIDAAQAQLTLNLGERKMQARWGHCPANQQYGPGVGVVAEDSWVLDIDTFTDVPVALDHNLVQELRSCAEVSYYFFRWVMSDSFIDERRNHD